MVKKFNIFFFSYSIPASGFPPNVCCLGQVTTKPSVKYATDVLAMILKGGSPIILKGRGGWALKSR